MSNESNIDELELRLQALAAARVIENGADAIATVRDALARALREIDVYAERYDNADNNEGRAKALNQVIQFCASNILGNMRLDLVADCQAALFEKVG